MPEVLSLTRCQAAWELYNSAYTIPGPEFAVPSARLWLNMAKVSPLSLRI